MKVAGIPVRSESVIRLTELLRAAGAAQTADILRIALNRERPRVALTIADVEAIEAVLSKDPPDDLRELRAALLERKN